MDGILKYFFWDYEGEDFFDYVFWNVHGHHFDINPLVVMWLMVIIISLSVIATIVLLIVGKVSAKVRQNENAIKKWKRALTITVCIMIIGVLLVCR